MMGVQSMGGQAKQDTQVIKDEAQGVKEQVEPLREFM